VVSIVIAGFVIRPAFVYFEKRYDAETARKKSLAVAIGIWLILQAGFFAVIFFSNPLFWN
jgi:hypothetical protein